jgi:hypothetical protein
MSDETFNGDDSTIAFPLFASRQSTVWIVGRSTSTAFVLAIAHFH